MTNNSLRRGVSINSPGIVTASERFTWPCAGYSIKAQRRHCGVPNTPGNWSPSTRSSGGLSTLVERQVRKIVPAEAARQPLAPDLRIGKIVDLAREAQRLRLRGGDNRAQARQDQDVFRQ